MTIRIVTDSTCDLPAELAEQNGIGIVPCYINIGEISYLDGVNITRREFYRDLPHYRSFPKTSAPGAGIFNEVYQRLVGEGATQIISMHIHSGLSNLAVAARLAASAVGSIKVTVIEVGQVALGLGFLALAAAQAALSGKSVEEIIQMIHNQDQQAYVFAALESLDYLRESGRAPNLLVNIASFLRIKPIIQLHRGELKLIGQVRTSGKMLDRLMEFASSLGAPDKIAVLHANAAEKARELARRVRTLLSPDEDIWISEVTPVLGVHVGPGAVGLACMKASHSI